MGGAVERYRVVGPSPLKARRCRGASVRWESGRDASTPPVGAGEPVAGCHPGGKLGAILHLELPQNARDMPLDRLARQEQRAGDVRVAGPTRDEVRDLALAFAQAGEVTARSSARPASPGADAQLAQQLIDVGSLRRGPRFLGDR